MAGNYSNFTGSAGMALSPETAGIFIVLYSITTLLAIVGNILTIFVFAKGRKCRTDLRPFLLNLAFADLIMAIFCIPFTFTNQLLMRWIFPGPTCPLVVFLQLTAVTASVYTNTAIGIDRFFAVVFPLKLRSISKRHAIMIAPIWIISIAINVVQFKVVSANINNETKKMTCVEDWGDDTMVTRKAYTLFLLFITYIIPLATLSITYSIVGVLLWTRKLPGQADVTRDQHHNKTAKQVIHVLHDDKNSFEYRKYAGKEIPEVVPEISSYLFFYNSKFFNHKDGACLRHQTSRGFLSVGASNFSQFDN